MSYQNPTRNKHYHYFLPDSIISAAQHRVSLDAGNDASIASDSQKRLSGNIVFILIMFFCMRRLLIMHSHFSLDYIFYRDGLYSETIDFFFCNSMLVSYMSFVVLHINKVSLYTSPSAKTFLAKKVKYI